MQRVRIGLTGLAFVFLAVLLAAIFTGRTSNEAPITPNSLEQVGTLPQASAPVEAPPTEPLAELGVAPGNADSSENATTPPSAAPSGGPQQ